MWDSKMNQISIKGTVKESPSNLDEKYTSFILSADTSLSETGEIHVVAPSEMASGLREGESVFVSGPFHYDTERELTCGANFILRVTKENPQVAATSKVTEETKTPSDPVQKQEPKKDLSTISTVLSADTLGFGLPLPGRGSLFKKKEEVKTPNERTPGRFSLKDMQIT